MDACRSAQEGHETHARATTVPPTLLTRRWREFAARGLLLGLFLGAAALWIVMVL